MPVNEMPFMNYTSRPAPNMNQTRFGVLGSLHWHSVGSHPVLQDSKTSLSPRFKLLLPPVKQRRTCVSIHMLKGSVLQRALCSAKVAYSRRNAKTIENITTVYPPS